MNISIIICTKDRPKDLSIVLNSIVKQNYNLLEILIVDGSDQSVELVANSFLDKLPIKYWHLRPPGLTRQRNFGISNLSPDSDWVGFLDDDLELEEGCLLNLKKFLEKDQLIAGVGLRINDQLKLKKNIFREFMLLDDFPGGKITKSGASAPIRPYESSLYIEWVYGGATFWRRKILSEFKFDEWFSGVGYCEDVDFSYRVSRKYKLAICADARCYHHHKEPSLQRMPMMGEWLVVAWWYFARVKNDFNIFWVCWGIFFMTINNLLMGLLKANKKRLLLFKGNLSGWTKISRGKVIDAKGFQK